MRQRAVHETKRDTRVRGMHDRPLPFHEHDVRVLRRFDGQALSGARNEVGHDGVDRNAASLDEDARLSGGRKATRWPR